MHGVTSHTAGQTRRVMNRTCSMPTLDKRDYIQLFTQFGNFSAFSSLHDMLGRKLNARNVFDLALYTTLHNLQQLDGTQVLIALLRAAMKWTSPPRLSPTRQTASSRLSHGLPTIARSRLQCVMPWPNATDLSRYDNRDEVFVCHEPELLSSNTTLGPWPPVERRRALQQEGEGDGDGDGEGGFEDDEERGEGGGGGDGRRGGGDGDARPGGGDFEDWDEWGPDAGDWDWARAAARRSAAAPNTTSATRAARARAAALAALARGGGEGGGGVEGGGAAGQMGAVRAAPRRRLLYHEFEIPLSPYAPTPRALPGGYARLHVLRCL